MNRRDMLAGAAVAGLAAGCALPAPSRILLARHGNVKIAYHAEGRGPLIILLPSAFRGAADLDLLPAPLARAGYRVLRPEPRGINGSIGPLDGVTLHDFATDVAAVIRAEGGGPALVAGHAYGNWVARATATDHPDLVAGIALLAASRKGPTPPDLVKAIADAANEGLPEEQRLAALRHAFFAPGNDPRPWLSGWHPEIREMQRRAATAVPQDVFWAAGGKPILEVQAEADPFLPKAHRGDLWAELGNQVRSILIAGASHALIPERPAETARALIDFAGSLSFRLQ